MPHLHLPAAHSDADIALAADVATALGSQDLYVTWSYVEGSGAIPEVEALLRDERPANPFAALLVAMAHGAASLWRVLVQGPAPDRLETPAQHAPSARATGEPAA
jgi:hypothetical protein